LAGHDGMVFKFAADTTTQFWMKDTRLALDIAFMTAGGSVLQTLTMPLCADNDDTCPRYGPPQQYRYALEAPAGSFVQWNLAPGQQVRIP
jgi:uncharacterized membrane protein (UPF0127 family)